MIRKKGFYAYIALIGIIMVVLYGVMRSTWNEPTDPKSKRVIVILKETNSKLTSWKNIGLGAKLAAEELNAFVDIRGSQTESDIQGQINILEQAVNEEPDAIVIEAANAEYMMPWLKKIMKTNIKLVTINSITSRTIASSSIVMDYREQGRKAAQFLVDSTAVSNVAMVRPTDQTETVAQREQGMRQRFTEYPHAQITNTYDTDGTEDKAYEITKAILTRDAALTAVIGLDEMSTIGVAKAIKELKLAGKVKVVGFDNSIYEIMDMEDGYIQAISLQKILNVGYVSVKNAVLLAKGQKVEPKIEIDSLLITRESMNSAANQRLLFPFIKGR